MTDTAVFTEAPVSPEAMQEHLENPLDRIGGEDVVINTEKSAERLELK